MVYAKSSIRRRTFRSRGVVKKRPYKRRYVARRRFKPNLQGFVSGMPKVRRISMRYNDQNNLTSTLGALGQFVFSANSIFDPSTTGTGHQPMGHDTWATLYNHYVVLGSRIIVKIIPTNPASPALCGIYLSEDSTLEYTNSSELIEAKKGTWRTIVPSNVREQTIMSKFSARKYFNVTDVKDNQARIGGTMGANPTDPASFVCWYETTDNSTNTVRSVVTIDYIVSFSEPRNLAQS